MNDPQRAYYIGTSPNSFRSGEAGEIIDVDSVKPEGSNGWVVCFHLRYADGKEDWSPVLDHGNYRLVPQSQIRSMYSVAK